MENFYVNGGLSLCFHLETQNTVSSEGLINAINLDQENTIHPIRSSDVKVDINL